MSLSTQHMTQGWEAEGCYEYQVHKLTHLVPKVLLFLIPQYIYIYIISSHKQLDFSRISIRSVLLRPSQFCAVKVYYKRPSVHINGWPTPCSNAWKMYINTFMVTLRPALVEPLHFVEDIKCRLSNGHIFQMNIYHISKYLKSFWRLATSSGSSAVHGYLMMIN